MAKIQIDADCGNAPKKILLKNFNIAFAEDDYDFLLNSVAEDIAWQIVGGKTVYGKDNFNALLRDMKAGNVSELLIHSIVTYGNEGAVNGIISMGGKKYGFADFYQFSSGLKGDKIKLITSYIIQLLK